MLNIINSLYRVLHKCTNNIYNVACDIHTWLVCYTTSQVHKNCYLSQNTVYMLKLTSTDHAPIFGAFVSKYYIT